VGDREEDKVVKEAGTGALPRLEVYQDKRHRKVGGKEVAKSIR
jgi:hypothetical protein